MRPIHFLVALLLPALLPAQNKENSDKAWTIDDILNTRFLRAAQFSPNNEMVVWTQNKAVKEKDAFTSDIYLTRLNIRKKGHFKTLQLTRSDESDYSPFFSKDGEKIYFLSGRKKGKKLWALSTYGGEAEKSAEFPNGISNIQWLSDSTFAYVASEGKTLQQEKTKKAKDNTMVIEDSTHWHPSRLFSYNLKTKKNRRLSQNTRPILWYTASRNGRYICYATLESLHYPSDAQPKPKIYLLDLSNGQSRRILQNIHNPYGIQFTDSEQGFYFVSNLNKDPHWDGAGEPRLYYYPLSTENPVEVPLQWENGLGGGYRVLGEDVLAMLANGPTSILAFYEKTGDKWTKHIPQLGEKQDHIVLLAISHDRSKILFEHSTAARLPRYYVADLQKTPEGLSLINEKELVELNSNLHKKKKVRYEIFRWKGYRGEEVNGLLYYPLDYEEGKRYPLMLSIHGGPAGVTRDLWRERWSTYPQLIAQRGAFVLKPNYHGSSNHGREFVESIKHNYYTPELTDIIRGIEELNRRGLIDTSMLGSMGWSNGAILTTMLTVRYPDMFKVACAGAGDVNWTSDYGTCRFGVSFDQSYFGGAPWDDVNGKTYNEAYVLYSPLFEMEKVKTPTIIFHGSEDRAVPRDQGWEYYRALQQAGQTPVRFLWFPGQPHGLRKITHQKRKMKEELKWIDQYLFGKQATDNETLKEDSPLAMLLQKDSLAHQASLYGKKYKGKLIPETQRIAKDSIAIGLLEVTNAQFKAFDKKFSYPAGQDNYPAQVSHRQAQQYIHRLNKLTGENYRLPTQEEAEAWQKKALQAAPQENTLTYWAAYKITPYEVDAFRQNIARAKQTLIKPVASFKPVKIGRAKVYDLGGNLAEYTQQGFIYGFSAYDYADPKAENKLRKEGEVEYVGFRVVLE